MGYNGRVILSFTQVKADTEILFITIYNSYNCYTDLCSIK